MSKLTDDEVFALIDKASAEFRRSQGRVRGNTIMPSDDPKYVLVRVVEASIRNLAQQGGEAVAWINYPVKTDANGNFAGHGPAELGFKRLSYGYDWDKAELLTHPTPAAAPFMQEIADCKADPDPLGEPAYIGPAAAPSPEAVPREADLLTQLIQRLNSTAYNLTKDECIAEAKKLRAESATPAPPAEPRTR